MDEPWKKFCLFPEARLPAHVFRRVLLALLLTAGGCMSGPPTGVPTEDSTGEGTKAKQSSNGSASAGDQSATTPAKPRTLPQAVHAYCERLHSPKPPAEEEAKKEADNTNPEKKETHPENGGREKPKGEKSPPAAGAQKERNNGGNGAEQPQDQGNDDKKKDENNGSDKKDENGGSWFSAHAQATMDTQAHNNFRAPYTGPLSLRPNEPAATSLTATLFLDARLWECGSYSGEIVFDPELSGGRGFSGVNGI